MKHEKYKKQLNYEINVLKWHSKFHTMYCY